MGATSVRDVCVHATDETGTPITAVYAKNPPWYAIYRTRDRVLIRFADDMMLEKRQRADLSMLAPIRGEINGLVDGWRTSAEPRLASRASRYDRRVADALVVAMEQDIATARTILNAVREDLVEERKSWARFLYVLVASAAAFAVVLAWLVAIPGQDGALAEGAVRAAGLWQAAGTGAVGAFFSIALAIRNRSIRTDLQMRDNGVDALLRIVIGAIAAVLLVALLRSGLIGLSIGGRSIGRSTMLPHDSVSDILPIVAFVGGFLERLVPDLLVGATMAEPLPPQAPSGPAGRAP